MKKSVHLLVAVTLLFLFCSMIPVKACEPEDCEPCHYWDDDLKECVSNCYSWQICCDGKCCSTASCDCPHPRPECHTCGDCGRWEDDCTTEQTCCNDQCCDGACCGGECCEGTCCDEACCKTGEVCIDGQCMDKCEKDSDCGDLAEDCVYCDNDGFCKDKCPEEDCVDGKCSCTDNNDCLDCEKCENDFCVEDCPGGEVCCGGDVCCAHCCGGNCCDEECCNGECCAADQTCYLGECTKECTDDGDCEVCQRCDGATATCKDKCDGGQDCCESEDGSSSNCCDGGCCGDTCCQDGQPCVNGKCGCESDDECSGNDCKKCEEGECASSCEENEECCNGDCCLGDCCDTECCGEGEECCGGVCCPPDQQCDQEALECCTPCGSDCCLSGEGCCGDQACYDLVTQGCCNGEVYDLDESTCCEEDPGNVYLCPADTTDCCDGACCGGDTPVCCYDDSGDTYCSEDYSGLLPIAVLDLDPGLICRNAQEVYKKAKWQAWTNCGETARVVDDGGSVTVTFEGIYGSDPSNLIIGDYFYMRASGSNVGDYKIKLISNDDGSEIGTGEGDVFEFELGYEKKNTNSGTAGNEHSVNESLFAMNAPKTSEPVGTNNGAMVQTTYDLTVNTSPTSISFSGKVKAKASINFNAHSIISIREWVKPVFWSFSLVKASYGIVDVEFGEVTGGHFGSSVAGLDVAIKIADTATWEYGDHQRDIGDVEDPWVLPFRVETFDEVIAINRTDDLRTYDPGTPIEFWIKGQVTSNSDLYILDILGDPDGPSSSILINILAIEDLEVSEDDGEYEIVSGN